MAPGRDAGCRPVALGTFAELLGTWCCLPGGFELPRVSPEVPCHSGSLRAHKCCSHLPTPLPGAEIPLVLQAHLRCHLLLVATPVTSFHVKFILPSEPQGPQEYLLVTLKTASPCIPGRIEAERPRAAETEARRLRPPPLSFHPSQSLQPNPAGATGRAQSNAKDPRPAPTGHQKLD